MCSVRWNSAVLNQTPGVSTAYRFCMMCNDIARFFCNRRNSYWVSENFAVPMMITGLQWLRNRVQLINFVLLVGAIYTYRLAEWRLHFCDGFALSEKSFRLTVRSALSGRRWTTLTVNGLTDFREIWYWRYFWKIAQRFFFKLRITVLVDLHGCLHTWMFASLSWSTRTQIMEIKLDLVSFKSHVPSAQNSAPSQVLHSGAL